MVVSDLLSVHCHKLCERTEVTRWSESQTVQKHIFLFLLSLKSRRGILGDLRLMMGLLCNDKDGIYRGLHQDSDWFGGAREMVKQVFHCLLHLPEDAAGQNTGWKFGLIVYLILVLSLFACAWGWVEEAFLSEKKMDCLFFLVSADQLLITVLQLLIIIPLTY